MSATLQAAEEGERLKICVVDAPYFEHTVRADRHALLLALATLPIDHGHVGTWLCAAALPRSIRVTCDEPGSRTIKRRIAARLRNIILGHGTDFLPTPGFPYRFALRRLHPATQRILPVVKRHLKP